MTDEVPRDPPFVNVIRPASNGYQGAYFNSKTPYVYIRPDPQFGRFLTVRFKAPTFTRIEDGKPATGMGPYFPIVRYCTKEKFERDACF